MTVRRKLDFADLLHTDQAEWTLVDFMTVLRRRRIYLLAWVAGMFLLATLYCLIATPRFQATGEIEVQKEPPPAFGLENSVTGDTTAAVPDSLDYSLTLETEAKILESSTLALQVIRDLKLETTHDYFPIHPSGFRIPGWVFFWQKPVEPLTVALDDAPNRRYAALKIFARRLKVTPETGTRLIEVSYSDPDPSLATAVVNRLLQALNDYTYQARFQATAQASVWLTSELGDLRRQAKLLDDKANRLRRDAGIYGEETPHEVVLDRLDGLARRGACPARRWPTPRRPRARGLRPVAQHCVCRNAAAMRGAAMDAASEGSGCAKYCGRRWRLRGAADRAVRGSSHGIADRFLFRTGSK